MDNFLFFLSTFDECLTNLSKVLARYEETLGVKLGEVLFYGA